VGWIDGDRRADITWAKHGGRQAGSGERSMSRTLFRNAMVWDGSGSERFPGDVLVEGNR
jgi:hypothetical protein